ncbi:DUF4038 domain-containing protein [Bradyrhizobium erythrophlei]|nr:DUF4038 domain-containing protein [Bradyrhizobium erythrophlei]
MGSLVLPRRASAEHSFSAAVTPAVTQGFPVALDATKTFFVDQNGEPCFGSGESPQLIVEALSNSDTLLYLNDRASRGINLLWMIVADNKDGNNPPLDSNGDAPFSGADFTNFNEPYWQHVDFVVQQCLARDMTILFMPFFVGITSAEGYHDSLLAASTARLQGYADFISTRYAAYPNIIWTLGGDADCQNATIYSQIDIFARRLKANDSNRLITMECFNSAGGTGGRVSSTAGTKVGLGSVPSWLDINWVYTLAPNAIADAQRAYDAGLPCMLGEDNYELENLGNGLTTQLQLRTEDYGSVLGGCVLGKLLGTGEWAFNQASTGFAVSSPSWQSQLNSQGIQTHQLAAKLFRSRAFHKLRPDTSNVVMTSGASRGAVCARTSDGQTVIAYLPNGNETVTIDMTKITDTGSQANCNWYNPQTGAVTNIGTFSTSGTRKFTSPDSNDWVLVADSEAAGLRAPGS